jgi:hypothetical protein
MLAKVSRSRGAGRQRCYHPYVSVFKRLPGTHMHVRTSVMIGVILMLVVLLSAVCYYRVG